MIEVPSAAMMADGAGPRGGLLLHRHQRPDPVHPGHGPAAPRARQAGRRAASGGAAHDRPHGAAPPTSAGKWVGVCGGIAGDPKGVALLVGLGVSELSVSIPSIAAVKAQIRGPDAWSKASALAPARPGLQQRRRGPRACAQRRQHRMAEGRMSTNRHALLPSASIRPSTRPRGCRTSPRARSTGLSGSSSTPAARASTSPPSWRTSASPSTVTGLLGAARTSRSPPFPQKGIEDRFVGFPARPASTSRSRHGPAPDHRHQLPGPQVER